MPLTAKGEKILSHLEQEYGSEAKAKEVLYAGKNAGTFTGIDCAKLDAMRAACDALEKRLDALSR